MAFELLTDPRQFLERAGPLLIDEARHNLILGVAGTLLRSPEVYRDYTICLASSPSGPIAAALMTPPYNLILADAHNDDGLKQLVAGLRDSEVSFPGVIGNRPTVDEFVRRWRELTGHDFQLSMAQGVFALESVKDVGDAPGLARIGKPGDLELIMRWMREFVEEALPDEPLEEVRLAQLIVRRLSGEGPSAYWIWEDGGRPVALSGHGGPTGTGIRIGPVYTPPQYRRRGYGTALVAAESRWLLEGEYDFCFLYTDMANPTSNAIYERIGYRRVAESAQYRLITPGRSIQPLDP